MAWFKRKADPISARARALNQEIASLEAEIKKLGSQIGSSPPGPARLPAASASPVNARTSTVVAPSAAPPLHEPIFERLSPDRLAARSEPRREDELYNDLGVRRYDLPALIGRVRNHFRGPSTTNPKLVSYLAAGGVQGLRPLRYEKRVARNRFLVLVTGLFFVLLGLIWTYIRHFAD